MSDSRFSALADDPRYRLPSRKEARTAVDPRFKTLFTNRDFQQKASVDRYGRKIKQAAGKQDLERLYRIDKQDKRGFKKAEKEVVGSSDEEDEDDDDDGDEDELATKKDPAREGGFSGSDFSEGDTSDESDSEAELAEETAGQEQDEDVPVGEVSKRIACVNLDWDNIRAADLMAVAQSFAPTGERVENVTVYPSEFGRERMEREEIEGPPREIFASSKNSTKDAETSEEASDIDDDDNDDDEKIKQRLLENQASEGKEFDTAKLRQYQLERLRYYYAVISCEEKSTAKAIYDSMDGREYLATSNFFDLRFVPDETSFEDDKPHDECAQLPQGYKPNDFRTEALTHSKVRLTWDADDATRKEVQKRAFSRAEIDENDLQAYIGSDESDADSISSRKSAAEDRKSKKREAQRTKMREALGLSAESTVASKSRKDKDEVVGEMQITFTSGFGGGKEGKGVFENQPQDEVSTRDRYIRKERERKQKRKEKMKISHNESAEAGAKDDLDVDAHQTAVVSTAVTDEDEQDNDPFNDPFFNDHELASKQEKAAKKAAKQAKFDARQALEQEAESRRAELELLMAEDVHGGAGVQHFDMREIERAQKAAKKAKKSKKKNKNGKGGIADEATAGDDHFRVETEDPRFKQLFESHEFAIDPSHARFKGSEAMKVVVEAGRKKRKHVIENLDADSPVVADAGRNPKKTKGDKQAGDDDVKNLVARLKYRGGKAR